MYTYVPLDLVYVQVNSYLYIDPWYKMMLYDILPLDVSIELHWKKLVAIFVGVK